MPKDNTLHKACYKEDSGNVKELLDNGDFGVNCRGAQERTPLHKSIGGRYFTLEKVRMLVERGADPNLAGSSRDAAPSSTAVLKIDAYLMSAAIICSLIVLVCMYAQ